MEGGKLSVTFPNYYHTSEISGGKLIEVNKQNRGRSLYQGTVCRSDPESVV